MFLLDTNTCIYFMKDLYPALTNRFLAAKPSDLAISSVTVFELEYGAAKSKWSEKTREKLALFLSPFRILPSHAEDAVVAANIRAHLVQRGTPIGPYDVQIAGQALARDLTVITHNTAEFSRVPGLKWEDWVC